jgi:hypothetical protein
LAALLFLLGYDLLENGPGDIIARFRIVDDKVLRASPCPPRFRDFRKRWSPYCRDADSRIS